jgi:class 3 adenylate cyclase
MDAERLENYLVQLRRNEDTDQETLSALESWIKETSALERMRINPYIVAAAQQRPVRSLVAEFLKGAHVGLFDLNWEIHCAHCNMITEHLARLSDATERSVCPMCQFSFSADFSDRVEVTFSLNRAIEDIGLPPFCSPPPILQSRYNLVCSLGQTSSAVVTLEPGIYRYFCPITLTKGILKVEGEPLHEVQEINLTQLSGRAFDLQDLTLRPGPIRIVLTNRGHDVSGLYLHSDVLPGELPLSELPQRLTGLEVIHYPEYQRFFSDRVLSARERMRIASVTVVFTDLTGSTRMYEQIGDPDAYNLVRDHFEILTRSVEKYGGVLIKTIGDAVMASFLSNRAALLAMDESMQQLRQYNQQLSGERRIHLRAGIHRGTAILVTLNDQIDYFGRTINKAARIQSVARGDELSVSAEVYEDADFQSSMNDLGWSPFRESIEDLKGIAGGQRVYTASLLPPR